MLFFAAVVLATAQSYSIKTIAGGAVVAVGDTATKWAAFEPQGVATDSFGNVYIAANYSCRIWVVDSSDTITQIIGSGVCSYAGDGGPASSAQLFNPSGVAVDLSGNIYIADTANNRIRKVSGGIITTIAGNGTQGDSGDGGLAINATVGEPSGIAVDSTGNVYFIDNYSNGGTSYPRIREISTAGTIATIAGGPAAGYSGDGGPATSAQLGQLPGGVATDSRGNVYIADSLNCRIREVSGGIINTIAGNGTCAYAGDGGFATSGELSRPYGVALDSAGNLYIADTGNGRVREVSSGVITTIAGNGMGGFGGDGGSATSAELSPYDLAVDAAGDIYISDEANLRVRKVSGGNINTVAGNGTTESGGDGGISTSAELGPPRGVAVDSSGNLYISDYADYLIREVSGGVIATIAESSSVGGGGDGIAVSSSLSFPEGLAVDSVGNVYVADSFTNQIQKLSGGILTTLAGNGDLGFSGDGGSATAAELRHPSGVAVDLYGNVYIADAGNNRIRKVSGGIITTVAGTGTAGFSGDSGLAVDADLDNPGGVAVDASGNLYIADTSNNRIREVTLDGIINTVAGDGTAGYTGNGGPATGAELAGPNAVALDSAGNLYIADACSIREVTDGILNTIAGTGNCGYGGDGGGAIAAQLDTPYGIAVDSSGNVFVADTANHRVRELSPVASQTIAFGPLPNLPAGAAPFALSATASSGLPVSFSSQSTLTCTVSGSTVTIVQAGKCSIQATQLGNANWGAALPVTQSFYVIPPPGTPSVVSVTPSRATGLTNDFVLTYSDTSGPAAFNHVAVIFNATVTAANSCFFLFYPSANLIYLVNDLGTGATSITTGFGTLSNSQCTLTASLANRSGNTITVDLEVTASANYTGKQNIFMYAEDLSSANTGWIGMGTWTPGSKSPEVVSSLTSPAYGLTSTFELQYADPSGAAFLTAVGVIFNKTASVSNSCAVFYSPAKNLIYLLNDAGTGSSSVILGSGTLSNSQCTVSGSESAVATSGDYLTLTLTVTAGPTYVGTQSVFMFAADSLADSGWINGGTWIP